MQNNQPQQTDPMAIVNQLRQSNNKMGMLNYLASQNPLVANTMNIINKYGGDPKRAFYEEANKMGVNPNSVFGMLNKQGWPTQ